MPKLHLRMRDTCGLDCSPLLPYRYLIDAGVMTLILENGAYNLKVGLDKDEKPKVIPNFISRYKSNYFSHTPNPILNLLFPLSHPRSKTERRRSFISNQLEECKDLSGLFYLLPFQKGYLVNWDTQRQVWDYVFGGDVLKIRPQDHGLVFSEPLFNFPSIQDTLNEIFFEEYKFKSLLRTPASTLSALNYTQSNPDSLCCVVIDSGYSFTHVVPYYRGKIISKGVLRIDVGGKLLTNHLKEIVSYRQLHVLDETYVMNQVKEDVCYVSQDFYGDMETVRRKGQANTVLREYVLPNFSTRRRGFIREQISKPSSHGQASEEQSLRLASERISVPELLFHPSDLGITQMGIPEAVCHSVSLTPKQMHPHLFANIVLTGGSALFPGFRERVASDVRKLAPDDYDVNVLKPEDPLTYAWYGGQLVSDVDGCPNHLTPVTLAEYREHGHFICYKRFTELQAWNWPADVDSR